MKRNAPILDLRGKRIRGRSQRCGRGGKISEKQGNGSMVYKYPNSQTEAFTGGFLDRPPINTEDKCYGSFFVDAKALTVFKKYVQESSEKIKDVNSLAEEQARFQYYFVVENVAFAMKYSKKKPPSSRVGRSFNCNACDDFFFTKVEMEQHKTTNTHHDIMLLYTHFRRIADEWFSLKTIPGYVLPNWVLEAEREGITCARLEAQKTSVEPPNPPRSYVVGSTPLTDDIFIGIDPLLSEDDFILATYDNIMEIHWPKPSTSHFCRCCNYLSYESEEELQQHLESAKHKEYEASYDSAWCVSCQRHTGSGDQLKIHADTSRHKMIKQLLADIRVRALNYWKREHARLRSGSTVSQMINDDSVVAIGGFVCKVCKIELTNIEEVNRHKQTQQHIANTGKELPGGPRTPGAAESREDNDDWQGRRSIPSLLSNLSWSDRGAESSLSGDPRGHRGVAHTPIPPLMNQDNYVDDSYFDPSYGYESFEDSCPSRYPSPADCPAPQRRSLLDDIYEPPSDSPMPMPLMGRERLLPLMAFRGRRGRPPSYRGRR